MPDHQRHDHRADRKTTGPKKRLDRVRRLYRQSPVNFAKSVLQYFQQPSRDIVKLRRARAILRFARARRKRTTGAARRWWVKRVHSWEARVERLENNLAERAEDFNVIRRPKWKAGDSRSEVQQSNYSEAWFFHHTVAGWPTTRAGEESEMRNLQRIAWSRGFADISYPFVVFDSGRVYEGRTLGDIGAHTLNYNSRSTALAWAGNMSTKEPTKASFDSARKLVKWRSSEVPERARPHYTVYPTACPGEPVAEFSRTI